MKKKKMKKYVHLYNLRIRDVFHNEEQSAVLSPAVVPKSTKAAPSAVGNTSKSLAGVILQKKLFLKPQRQVLRTGLKNITNIWIFPSNLITL